MYKFSKNIFAFFICLFLSFLYSNRIFCLNNDTNPYFQIYWNVPTYKCVNHSDFFRNLSSVYNITQNINDTFRAVNISLFYDPGHFPMVVDHSGKVKNQNEGIPQKGNLTKHIEYLNLNFTKFNETLYNMTKSINVNFTGLGIIDFEASRPVLQQNWGVLTDNKRVAYEYQCNITTGNTTASTYNSTTSNSTLYDKCCSVNISDHFNNTKLANYTVIEMLSNKTLFNETIFNTLVNNNNTTCKDLKTKAEKNFEEHALQFMIAALNVSKSIFPFGKWGYYGFPYCYNMNTNQNISDCKDFVKDQNDKNYWNLFENSTALYPSVYIRQNFSCCQKEALMKYRVQEAMRVSQNHSNITVLPYIWFKYNEKQEYRNISLTKDDMNLTFTTVYEGGANGLIVWGSSSDLSNYTQCENFKAYVNDTLGPIMQEYSKKQVKKIKLIEFKKNPNNTDTDICKETEKSPSNNTQSFCKLLNDTNSSLG